MKAYAHVPVMLPEVEKYLAPKSGGYYLDGTLGGAGYTLRLAELAGPSGRVLAMDLDDWAIKNAAEKLKAENLNNVLLVQDNFKNLDEAVSANFPANTKFDGLVLDLGLSSAQLDDEERGFSFKGERPLDMAFGPDSQRSTEDIVNNYSLPVLTRIFRDYGEERQAYKIAKAIVNYRRTKRLRTTTDLITIIEAVIPPRFYNKIHPATKVFQALRVETNGELTNLSETLPKALELLKPSGRLVVVSFQSGEDRIVKRFFRAMALEERLEVLTKKPLIPTDAEMAANPRARSAKLRAARKPKI